MLLFSLKWLKQNWCCSSFFTKLSTKYIMISLKALWITIDSFCFPVQLRLKTSYSSYIVSSSSFINVFGKKTGPMTLRIGPQGLYVTPKDLLFKLPAKLTWKDSTCDCLMTKSFMHLFIHPCSWLFTDANVGETDFPFLRTFRAQSYNW